MGLKNKVIYLLGFPGVGKYTIANHLASLSSARLIDNHTINNPIYSLIDIENGQKISEGIRSEIRKVRVAVFHTMAYHSPAEWSFILTNVLLADDPIDQGIFNAVEEMAKLRQACFVPVRLHCDLNENISRMSNADRSKRFKSTNPALVSRYAAEEALIAVNNPNVLDLDVTPLSPEEAASAIMAHIHALN